MSTDNTPHMAPRNGVAASTGHAVTPKVPHAASGYRPDVQGLRALAVLLVLGFHLYPEALPGGYVGVDVFFVISGFLITGHLAKRFTRTGRVGLVEFYGRRARRLLPAAVLVLVVTWVGSRLLLPVTQRAEAADQVRASALYIENWVLADNSVDYMHQGDAPSPVQHYWSLSVEEQFYLIWPLLFVAAMLVAAWAVRRGRGTGNTGASADGEHAASRGRSIGLTTATIGAAAIVAASLWFSVHETATNQAAAYFVTPTRLWELGLGGLLALAYPWVSRAVGRIGLLGWAGLGTVIASAFLLDGGSAFPGYLALAPTLGAVLLIACGSTGARLSPAVIMARRPAVFIGDISYSVYLWHWPIIVLYLAYSGGSIGILDGPLIACTSILLAWASTRWIEDPFRRAKWIAPHPGRSLATVATAIVPVALTTAFLLQQSSAPAEAATGRHPGAEVLAAAASTGAAAPTPGEEGAGPPDSNATPGASETPPPATISPGGQTPTDTPQPSTGEAPGTASYPTRQRTPAATAPKQAAGQDKPISLSSTQPPVADAPKDLPLANQEKCKATTGEDKVVSCIRGDTSDPELTIALVGDSFAGEWSSVLIDLAKERHWKVVTVTHDGCAWTAQMVVRDDKPFTECHDWGKKTLHYLLDEVHPDVVMTSFHPAKGTPDHPGFNRAAQRQIADGMVKYWHRLADAGAYVIGVHPTPDPGKNIPDCLAARTGSVAKCTVPRSKANYDGRPTAIGLAVDDIGPAHATEINLNDYICGARECPPVVGNVIVYRDEKHLTKSYSMTLAPYLKKALLAVPAMEA